MTKNTKGFTLVELLAVIAIIGILASIVVGGLQNARASGRDGKRISDIKNIQLHLALYYNDNVKYPATLSLLAPTYMSVVPKDPKDNTTPYSYVAYATVSSQCSTPTKYHLGAITEVAKDSGLPSDDVDLAANTTCVVADFYGASDNCNTGGISTPDKCYDVTNN